MFVLSQLMSAITQPVFWLALWWGVALLMISRWRRAALGMLWLGLVVLGLLGFEALPHALLRPLENQYPVPSAALAGQGLSPRLAPGQGLAQAMPARTMLGLLLQQFLWRLLDPQLRFDLEPILSQHQ